MHTSTHHRARLRGLRPFYRLLTTGALAAWLGMAGLPAQAARLALVIGNDGYTQIERLKNARNDARLMARALTEAGFEIVGGVRSDLSRKALWNAIDQFRDRIRAGDEVVFYFAGHGIDADGALLLPVDIENGSKEEITREAVPLRELPGKFKNARFSLLVIDACRDNPFPKNTDGTRAFGDGTRGLGRPPQADMPEGSVVLLAASAGQKALDHVPGESVANGLFTHEFVRAIRTPGQDVFTAIRQTRNNVYAKAKTKGHDQRPALSEENTIGEPFVFIASVKTEPDQAGRFVVPGPGPVGAVNLEELRRQDDSRKSWAQWQAKMKTDFDRTVAFKGSADLQAKAWEQFLATWSQDNPLSQEDDGLRAQAQSQMQERQQEASRLTAAANPQEPYTFFVQTGAFRAPEDAKNQQSKLQSMGYEAAVTEREQSGRTVYRVRLGPFARQSEAESMKSRLESAGLDGLALVRVQR